VFEAWHLDLLASARVARLGTISADGRPHLVPVCFALCDGMIGITIDEKPKRTSRLARLRNIERDPRVTLLVDHYEEDWTRLAWLRIDGRAEVLRRGDAWPEALASLRRRYPLYASMSLEERPLIRITPERLTAWRA
jgi:PPOX class probable F420-dependent enzyme